MQITIRLTIILYYNECTHVCNGSCTCEYMHVCVHVYVCVCVGVCVCLYARMCLTIYICVCVCVCVSE